MNETGRKIHYKTLETIFEESGCALYWAIILVLYDGSKTGMVFENMREKIVALGAPRGPDIAHVCIRSELKDLIDDGLVENQINEADKFKLTCSGRKVAKTVRELINSIIAVKQAKDKTA